jgi:uncharacterized protein
VRFLLVFLVVLVLAWRWRTWRESVQLQKGRQPPTPPAAAPMVACRQCGVHIPANEAVTGAQGTYCCVAHRSSAEP